MAYKKSLMSNLFRMLKHFCGVYSLIENASFHLFSKLVTLNSSFRISVHWRGGLVGICPQSHSSLTSLPIPRSVVTTCMTWGALGLAWCNSVQVVVYYTTLLRYWKLNHLVLYFWFIKYSLRLGIGSPGDFLFVLNVDLHSWPDTN